MAEKSQEVVMPIRPEMKALYPPDWADIVRRIKARDGNRCKWCGAANYEPHPETGSRVVLTTAHINHDPTDNRDENLASLCNKCHNGHDAKMRRSGIIQRSQAGMDPLFGKD
jgi:hypothetical protein